MNNVSSASQDTNPKPEGEPESIRILREFSARVARHRAQVEAEYVTLGGVAGLMKKWGESRPGDAMSREARSRAIREAEDQVRDILPISGGSPVADEEPDDDGGESIRDEDIYPPGCWS